MEQRKLRIRTTLGIVFLIAAPALSIGAWDAANGPLETLAWYDAHRGPGDSAAYASAQYHAAHARASHANRWRPTGYATLGLLGTLIGIGLLIPYRRRTTA